MSGYDDAPSNNFSIYPSDPFVDIRPFTVTAPTDIIITTQDGRQLVLSWKGNIVTVYGSASYDKAAETFLDAIGYEAIRRAACKGATP